MTLQDDIGPLRTVVAGGCAGVTLWTLIFPADVVKSRLQVSGSSTPMLVMMSQIYRYVAIHNQRYLLGK